MQVRVNDHHSAGIVKLVAVVRSREDCHELSAGKKLIPVLNDLVCTAHQVKVMPLQKSFQYVSAEGVRNAACTGTPSANLSVWVRPQQVRYQSCIRYDEWPPHIKNLLHAVQ